MSARRNITREEWLSVAHLSQSAAARALGVHPPAAHQAAKRFGITFASIPGKRPPFSPGTPKEKRRPIEAFLALRHLTQEEAAQRLGCSRGNVSKRARRHGITFRGARSVRELTDEERERMQDDEERLEVSICRLLTDDGALAFASARDNGAKMHEALDIAIARQGRWKDTTQ